MLCLLLFLAVNKIFSKTRLILLLVCANGYCIITSRKDFNHATVVCLQLHKLKEQEVINRTKRTYNIVINDIRSFRYRFLLTKIIQVILYLVNNLFNVSFQIDLH